MTEVLLNASHNITGKHSHGMGDSTAAQCDDIGEYVVVSMNNIIMHRARERGIVLWIVVSS